MLQFCSLYSGSSGNSFLIKSDNSCILVDAGVSYKKISTALSNMDIDINTLDAILLTHEHIDHSQSLGTISFKHNIPVYANSETWSSLGKQKDKIIDYNKKYFYLNQNFEIKDLVISPFSVPHDAANPCGFNIYNENSKLSIATDLGHINNNVLKAIEGSSSIMLEANYDSEILKYSPYPLYLKRRISGTNGHLENKDTGKALSTLFQSGLKEALLIHLSKENNFPELAYETVSEEISKIYSNNSLNIKVAPRNEPSQLFNVS